MTFFRLLRLAETPCFPVAGSRRIPLKFPSIRFAALAAALLLCLCTPARAVPAENHQQVLNEITRLLAHGGYIVTSNEQHLFSHHSTRLLIPASTWKIATALLALETLGADFRFQTRFYSDEQNNLYIQGTGDPFLVSEEVALIVKQLGRRLTRINDIVLDDSSFQLSGSADGTGASSRSYDAINSGLAVNFNTVHLVISETGRVNSAEPQTPTLPVMVELGKGLPAGNHRLNIGGNHQILRHTGELFRAFQKEAAIEGSGMIRHSTPPDHLTPVYIHSSKPLAEIISALLLYSNNFIANQIFLTSGARHAGYPATWEKAKTALEEFLILKTGLNPQTVQVEEGSGLSRRNLITPEGLLAVLAAFKPHAHLLPRDQSRLLKSGTLTGVYAYAGYFERPEGLDGFVLILNQEKNHRDRLLNLLEKLHREPIQPVIHAQAE